MTAKLKNTMVSRDELTAEVIERKLAEQNLQSLTTYQGELLAAIPDIVMEVDNNKIYTWTNQAGLEFFGDDVIGKEASFYFEGEQDTYNAVKPLFGGEESTFYLESWQRRKDGQKRLLAWWCRVLKDNRGNVTGALSSAQDITERRRMEEEKEKFTKEIAEKNTELERFTYTVSHDLKSPLVTIKTFLGYLKQDITDNDAGRIEKDMLFMNGATDKMNILLGELLEMSRIGRIVNPPAEVTFKELAEEAERIVAGPILEGKVQVRLNDEPVILYGDRSRLVEIWQNLVENAVKFMGDQPSPHIDIGFERHDGETVFFVRDNGIGIDPKYQSKLFNLFEKINPRTEGTGMGLAITKRIVELYQGQIRVESKGEGQGSCFFFTLPGALKEMGKGVRT
jgi:PAS domain S-box-containing protein